jgi:DNA-binding NtrC family response regulator
MARILVIDDDPDMRTMVGQTLKSAGHEVALATDGQEGVEQCRARPADLVVTDIYMPNREGLETMVEIRKRFPEIAIIAMSGRDTARTMLSIAQRLGAAEVLQKPFVTGELRTAVERVLQARSRTASACKGC